MTESDDAAQEGWENSPMLENGESDWFGRSGPRGVQGTPGEQGKQGPEGHGGPKWLIVGMLVAIVLLAVSVGLSVWAYHIHADDDEQTTVRIQAAQVKIETSFCVYLRARAAVPPIPGQQGVNELNKQAAALADEFGCPP